MTDATATPRLRTRRYAYGALLGFTLLVAAVTFVLSFSGLDDYGRRVARLGDLSPLVPIGVDGLTLCAVAATFLLGGAPWRVRLYAWFVFAVAVGASVAGNLSHADAKDLPWQGHIGAAAWPILLALASHLVIVARRWMERAAAEREVASDPIETVAPSLVAESQDESRVPDATPEGPARDAEPSPVAPHRPHRRRKTSRTAAKTKSDDADKAVALRRVNAGESVAKVALSLGVHKTTIYRWRDEETSRTETSGGESADTPEEESRELVNTAG